jgi:hypothetical protein
MNDCSPFKERKTGGVQAAKKMSVTEELVLVMDVLESRVDDGLHVSVGQGVVHILTFASSLHEIRETEDLQLVGDSGLGHAQQFCQVANAESLVSAKEESVEKLRPGAVTTEFEEHRHLDVLFLGGHPFPDVRHYLFVQLGAPALTILHD